MTRGQRPGGDGSDPPASSAGGAGESPGRLSGVRPLGHDDDERPSREDRSYGSTIFTRSPVPLPRFLRGGGKRGGR